MVAEEWRRSKQGSLPSPLLTVLVASLLTGAVMAAAEGFSRGFDLVLVVFFDDQNLLVRLPEVLGLAVGLVLLSGAALTYMYWRRQLRFLHWVHGRSHAYRTGYQLTLSEHEVISRSPLGERRTPWSLVTRLSRNARMWFLFVDSVSYYWIPASAIGDQAGLEAFVERQIARSIEGRRDPC
jgi:hypothetical protein